MSRFRKVLSIASVTAPLLLSYPVLDVAPASAEGLCSILSDINAKLKADKSPTKIETIRNLSSYITDRFKQLEVINNCSEFAPSVSFSCSLNNYAVRSDSKPKASPGFVETDAALRKCYKDTKNNASNEAHFQKTYSWGNDRFDLILRQMDEALILNVIEIIANPRETGPDSEPSK